MVHLGQINQALVTDLWQKSLFSPREMRWLQVMRLTARQLGLPRTETFAIIGFTCELRPGIKVMHCWYPAWSCISM